MKRSREEEEEKELPELPIEIWSVIAGFEAIYGYKEVIDRRKLNCWAKLSLINKSFNTRFNQLISTESGLAEIFPVWSGGLIDFKSFSRTARGEIYDNTKRRNVQEWLKLSTYSENHHKCSKVSQWIESIESFESFSKSMIREYGINKKIWGGKITALIGKIDKNWSNMTNLDKTKVFYLFWKLIEMRKSKPIPVVKAPIENTKVGCLFVYREEWKEEGERNGRVGEIYSDTGSKLYLGAFKPMMSSTGKLITTRTGDIAYQFQFKHYNGDNLRHHNSLREACERVSILQSLLDVIESLLPRA